jgi:6-phosphogluconolactonase
MPFSGKICSGTGELIEAAAEIILPCAEQSIARHQQFQIVLAGGQTPAPVYKRLCQAKTDWSAWHVNFSDERSVPANDPGCNSHMVHESLFSHVPVPEIQIHVIETSGGTE